MGVIVTLMALLAPLFAALHRHQMEDVQVYRESPLIVMEFGSLLCGCGNLPIVAIAIFVLLARKRYKRAAFLVAAGLLMLVLGYAAIALDAPTLLYAT